MVVTHKLFLSWLVYVVVSLFSLAVGIWLGLPQLVLAHDHAHLGLALILMWLLGEALSGVQAVRLSRQHRAAADALSFLEGPDALDEIEHRPEGLVLHAGLREHLLPKGTEVEAHARALVHAHGFGPHGLDQRLLLDVLADRLARTGAIGDFVASRIVWVGILATIIGVILAFWPFMTSGFDPEAIRANLGGFFAGIAVAFIPTAVSFVFKIMLDVNTRLMEGGVADTVDSVAAVSAGHLVPFLANNGPVK